MYGVAKAVGRMCPDDSDSRLPAKRMPMGLLEYMLNFFNADSYSQVGMHCHSANKVARPCMSHSYHCSIVQISSAFIQMPTLIKGVMFMNFAPVLQIGKCPPDYHEWLVTVSLVVSGLTSTLVLCGAL